MLRERNIIKGDEENVTLNLTRELQLLRAFNRRGLQHETIERLRYQSYSRG